VLEQFAPLPNRRPCAFDDGSRLLYLAASNACKGSRVLTRFGIDQSIHRGQLVDKDKRG
jgi:hypothetical protein